MKTLLHWTWGLFLADASLAIATILGAIFDRGDAAGRGLGQVYAVFAGGLIVVLAIIVALNSYFRTRIGLGITLALEIVPWAYLAYEAAARLAARIG